MEENMASSMVCQSASSDVGLPPPPERPLDSDCCGGGCSPCVLDIYQEELELWREECQRIKLGRPKLNDQQSNNEVANLSPQKYTKYQVVSIVSEAKHIVRIRCQLQMSQSLGLSIGQHIIIRFCDCNGKTITRQYTPTSSLSAQGFFELMIKIYPDGRASQYVKQWAVGDHIEARGPAGHLVYKLNKYNMILMLCAGTGVAPMCQVTQAILEDEKEETRLRLIYSARDYSCLMAKQEIGEWRRHWNFSALFLLSQEPEHPSWSYRHGEDVKYGRLSLELIQSEINVCRLDKVLVLVCGPQTYDSFVLECLENLKVPSSNIHKF